MTAILDFEERKILLQIAREAVTQSVHGKPIPDLHTDALPDSLQRQGASFVTLTSEGSLRGCIGSIEAVEPLAADVQRHAVDAALSDPRFPPVHPRELDEILIEISILTPPESLDCPEPGQRAACLRPGIDGVLIRSGIQRATFLPQVWEKISEAEKFLEFLCQKAWLPADAWKKPDVEVLTYQVLHFNEEELMPSSG